MADNLNEPVSVQRFLERIVDERDRLYDVRFKASETAVNAALASVNTALVAALVAQEKQTSASFASSEKAIAKAEEAQRDYNVRSNEFRGQLDDQAKMLMPRAEAMALFQAMEDKIAARRTDTDHRFDIAASDIASLRESRA